jgi:hypothetical protein
MGEWETDAVMVRWLLRMVGVSCLLLDPGPPDVPVVASLVYVVVVEVGISIE